MDGYIAQQLLNGLILGSMYALVAIGFTMIYGIIRLINFAHGDIVMIGAFMTLGLVISGKISFPVIIILVFIGGALMGLLVERVAFRPMRGAPQVTGFITSLAISILLQNLGILLLTAQPRNFFCPDYLQTNYYFGPVSLRAIDLGIVVTAVVLMIFLVLLVRFTRLGMAMRATAENLNVARLMGININQIDPLLGFVPGLKAFVAAVIGGVGSIPGAMLGGYLLGFGEVLFVGLLPPIYSSYRDAFVFTTLILILLALPNGLLGRKTEEKA